MLFSSIYRHMLRVRPFHTSSPRHVHPLIWIFLKPALKGVAFITGRSTRKWFRQLPPEKRSIFFQHLERQKYKYMGIFGTLTAVSCYHYYSHLETSPITGRKRYMLMTSEQLKLMSELQIEELAKKFADRILPVDSTQTQLVAKIAKKLIGANMDIPIIRNIKWSVRVLDSNERNAYVLPSGDIYATRAMVETTTNEDQLATVLGHEIAHALLDHSREKLSYTQFMDFIGIVSAFIIWTIFPSDWTSLFATYLFGKYLNLTNELPYSRNLEQEADEVGLMLTAKACYDIRESVNFWQNINQVGKNSEIPEFLSTHPASAKRAENLIEKLPWALDLRYQCNCKPLSENKTLAIAVVSTTTDKKTTGSTEKGTALISNISLARTVKNE